VVFIDTVFYVAVLMAARVVDGFLK